MRREEVTTELYRTTASETTCWQGKRKAARRSGTIREKYHLIDYQHEEIEGIREAEEHPFQHTGCCRWEDMVYGKL